MLKKKKQQVSQLNPNSFNMQIRIEQLIKALTHKGYTIFEDDSKPLNLNIVGIRSADPTPNIFNDLLTVFWKYKGNWSILTFPCTTDPGLYWLQEPGNPMGTAILKEGQYMGSHKLGQHKGKYEALVQQKPVTVIRDADRDKELDYDNGVEDTGIFGINIHRANSKHESVQVDRWSAGCVVVANPHLYDVFMHLCGEALEIFDNSFTLTLINEEDIKNVS